MPSRQILNAATTGNSDEFKTPDKSLALRLVILGTSSTPISAYIYSPARTKNLILKIRGITGGGASIKLQSKSDNSTDDFSDTGDVWEEDVSEPYYYS